MRIVFIGNQLFTMVKFRGPVIDKLTRQGHEVICVCSAGSDRDVLSLKATGAHHREFNFFDRKGLNPLKDLRAFIALCRLLHELQPDCVFSFFIKPVIWGTLAASFIGVPRRIGLIEGFGSSFGLITDRRPLSILRKLVVRSMVILLLWSTVIFITKILVLNINDKTRFSRLTFRRDEKIVLIDGIGVDVNHFHVLPLPADVIRFTFVGRLIKEKGIEMFLKCAEELRPSNPGVRFRIVGGFDEAYSCENMKELISCNLSSGVIEWSGHVDDVRSQLCETSVFVLPTLYSEGLPLSIMEAMAMGRPIITTDMPGAVSSITSGESGFVVPAGSIEALIAACAYFCQKPDEVHRMGLIAAEEARSRYDLNDRVDDFLSEIYGK
jgi:glycosyltransferase involved in cell wall biosynthesis